MTDQRVRLFVSDMMLYARLGAGFVVGRTEEDIGEDDMLRLAVVHAIQTVGEAAKNVPEEVRELSPDIPWRQIARTRDINAHHYFGVKLDVVWLVARDELPKLALQLEALLAKFDSDQA